MIRVALYILLVGVVAFGAAWLADRPGDIVLDWQGWHVETSLMVAAVAVLVIFVALMIVWTLIRWILHGPAAMSGFFRERRQTKGYRALSRGMIAAAAGDARLARHSAKEADKLLRDEPLALLLDAQAAQLSGDRKAARKAFETMAERPDTELLGLRGLLIEAQRAGDEETARLCVARAAERAPGLGWAANALLEQQTREGDWQAALATVERNAEHRLIDKKAAKRSRAVLMTAQAIEVEEAEPERALALALEAHKLAPELVPAAVVAGRLSAAAGNTRQVTRIIEKTWRQSPHPDLAEVYAHARPGDSARDRLKRAQTLLQKMPNNEEGRIAVAVAAIEARDWKEARKAVEPLTRSAPSQRICMLMADIEEGETGDAGKVREWLARAVRAPRDPAWTADGYIAAEWAPVSPITGQLDAFEWKVPVEALTAPGQDEPDTPAEAIDAPRAMIEVTPQPATRAPTGAAAPQASPAPATPAPASPAPASAATGSMSPGSAPTGSPAPAGPAAATTAPAGPEANKPAPAPAETPKTVAPEPDAKTPKIEKTETAKTGSAPAAGAAAAAATGPAPPVAPASPARSSAEKASDTGTPGAAAAPGSASDAPRKTPETEARSAPVPEKTPPQKASPEQTGPEKTGPEKTGPEKTGPQRTGTEKSETGATRPDRSGKPEAPVPVGADATPEPGGDRSAEEHRDAVPMAFDRPPDDPGPVPDDEDTDKPKRRFGLF
ncbi:heme biosynthesis protein HemY [Microbaculum marinum]|uniref:Heme biosynthesis HemY N-terminal domain-containing protein n=1 Tax=Microbaculum marinum TaxID=1764581 RepID=A0AAW9RM91_9HYPH